MSELKKLLIAYVSPVLTKEEKKKIVKETKAYSIIGYKKAEIIDNILYISFYDNDGLVAKEAVDKEAFSIVSMHCRLNKFSNCRVEDARSFNFNVWYARFSPFKGEKDIEKTYFTGYKAECVEDFCFDINIKKSEERAAKAKKKADDIFADLKPVSNSFMEFLKSTTFADGGFNYIFFNKEENTGYCTACKKTVMLPKNYKHLSKGRCPNCGRKVTFQNSNHCKSRICDESAGLIIQKCNHDKIVGRFYMSSRYIENGDPAGQSSYYINEAMRIIATPDKIISYANKAGNKWTSKNTSYVENGYNIDTMYGYHFHWNGMGAVYANGLASVIKDSFLERTGAAEFLKPSEIRRRCKDGYDVYFAGFSYIVNYISHPEQRLANEYFVKSGFDALTMQFEDYTRKRLLDESKTKISDIMKIDRQTYRKLLPISHDIGYKALEMAQYNPSLTAEEWLEFANKTQINASDVARITKFVTAHKAIKYLEAQRNNTSAYYSYLNTSLYADYLEMADELKMFDALQDENGKAKKNKMALFPKNLKEAHDLIADKAALKKRDDKLAVIDKNLPKLHEKFDFVSETLQVKAPEKAIDVIREGQYQMICVGNSHYIGEMADGKSTILFVRKNRKPNKPYYTMQIEDDAIVQVRGYDNIDPEDDVNNLVKEFAKEKGLALRVNE